MIHERRKCIQADVKLLTLLCYLVRMGEKPIKSEFWIYEKKKKVNRRVKEFCLDENWQHNWKDLV